MLIEIESNVVETYPSGSGGLHYGWATEAARLLTWAEDRYGLRNERFICPDGRPVRLTFCGVELHVSVPQLSFPSPTGQWEGHLAIWLDRSRCKEYNEMIFELAHECVHLLCPTGSRQATYMEEGCAVLFSEWVMSKWGAAGYDSPSGDYAEAKALTHELLAIDQDAIKRLRSFEPWFHRMNADFVCQHYPTLPRTVADKLVQRM